MLGVGWNLLFTIGSTVLAQANLGNTRQAQHDALVFLAQAAATVSLANLSQVYDGTEKVATITTDPPGLAVAITYDGNSIAPTNAGSYVVEATVSDPDYTGSASGTLVIAKASATVTLGDLAQTFDGEGAITDASAVRSPTCAESRCVRSSK